MAAGGGVGHVEDGGHTAEDSAFGAGEHVFDAWDPALAAVAKMHVRVEDAGENVEMSGVKNFPGGA